MDHCRVTEESGPDEDLLLRNPQLLKVIDVDDPMDKPDRGVISVERCDPVIESFLSEVPRLISQNETLGLIWDENLKPDNFKYENGVHFVSTLEADKKTDHSTVSFYRDEATGTKFAIKTLHKGTDFLPEEVKVGLTIQHQNICSVYGIIISKGKVHILLEHAGSPLYNERAWIAKCPKRMKSFAKQSFQALDVIHRHGFVHCDIKPDNIMISRHGCEEFTVKVIDFGTCHIQGSGLPSTAHTTLLYWSPEIWQALMNKSCVSCTPAMDVYALTLTLHFVHTGNHLMERFQKEDLKNLMIKTPDDILLIALPETIPSDLSAVMKSCLCGDQKVRSSADEAFKQLTECTLLRRPSTSSGEVNYKDSFYRIYSSMSKTTRHANPDTPSTVYKNPAICQSLFKNLQEKGACPSSTCIDKREFKTVAKAKKNASLSANKFNKSSLKFKKRTSQFKQSLQMVTQMPAETFQKPFVSPDSELEKGVEPKLDDNDYCYSNLLKRMALCIKDPNQISMSYAPSTCLESSSIVQAVMADKSTGKALKLPEKLTSHKSRDNEPEMEPQDKCKLNGKSKIGMAIENGGKRKKDVQGEIAVCNMSPPAGNQAVTESCIQVQDNSGKTGCESGHDDMEFVLSAFKDNVFTGADDDILDNMCAMLDKDELSEPSSSSKGFEGEHQVSSIKHGTVNTEEEPMDAEHEESASVSKVTIRNTLNPAAVKGNRKRVAESSMNPSCIPGKTVFVLPSIQDMKTHQLPNFDQILPENC